MKRRTPLLAIGATFAFSACQEASPIDGGGRTSNGGASEGQGGADPTGGSALGSAGDAGASGAADDAFEEVSLEFRAKVSGAPFACASTYPGEGASDTEVTPRDLRFYVSNVRLIDTEGTEVPVEIVDRAPWQGESTALLDFEDASGECAAGNTAVNTLVTGRVAAGDYVGLVFSTSVPSAVNHDDPTTLASPLQVSSMHWGWLMGYIFFRAELIATTPTNEAVAPGLGLFHLGSVGCALDDVGPDSSPETVCSAPNRNEVRFETFDLAKDAVVLDLHPIFAATNLTENAQCHSSGSYCDSYFRSVGVDFASGSPMEQTAFSREPK